MSLFQGVLGRQVRPAYGIAILALSTLLGHVCVAQGFTESRLPDSPGFVAMPAPGQEVAPASLSGTVHDANHGIVPNAKVTLVRNEGGAERTTEPDPNGQFNFVDLVPGVVKVTVTAPGFETFVSSEVTLAPAQELQLPDVLLSLAATSSSVQVMVSEQQLATEQIKAQEKQRVLGVFPNFYTSFLWEAAPLRPKQKFGLAVRSRIDPVMFATIAIAAAIEQKSNTFPGYGGGPQGYGKRYGAALADSVSERMIGGAILPSLFHQDPRYFYKGSGSVGSRLRYAISEAFMCRGDNGKQQVNYSYILGNFLAAGLSNAYRADVDRSASVTITNGFVILAGHVANDIGLEFLLKRMTSNIPKYANGRPSPPSN